MTTWETPNFVEVDMSAEIGGYQGEDEQRPGYAPDFMSGSEADASHQPA